MDKTTNEVIILFDGICNLCNGAVNFLLKRDKKPVFKYASLQSDAAAELLTRYGLNRQKFDSIVVIKDNHVFERSDAAIIIASNLGFPWSLFKFVKIVPRSIRDAVYNLISKNRYRFFGKRDQCMMPDKSIMSRFL